MKMIVVCRPFDRKQKVYINEADEEIAFMEVELDDLFDAVIQQAKNYDLTKINLIGQRMFVQGVEKKIKEVAVKKYNKDDLEITIN